MKRLAELMATVLTVGLLMALPAQAHSGNGKWDGNDAGGPFDVHYTWYSDGHGQDNWSGRRRVWLCVKTYNPWQNWQLGSSHDGKGIGFALDTRADRSPDYYVGFTQGKGGGLVGRLYNRSGENKGTTNGYRFGKKKGGCVYIKEYRIKPISQVVRYTAFSDYYSQRVCSGVCSDSTSWYSHRY